MAETTETENASSAPASVECRASSDHAVRLFILTAMPLAFGIWCLTDPRPQPDAWDMANINKAAAYILNNWGPVVFFPLGIVGLYFSIRFIRRVMVADEKGIGYVGKDQILWDQVTKLDATALKKEILVLEAPQRALKLDGYKLRNFRDLVAFIEKNVPQDKWIRPT